MNISEHSAYRLVIVKANFSPRAELLSIVFLVREVPLRPGSLLQFIIKQVCLGSLPLHVRVDSEGCPSFCMDGVHAFSFPSTKLAMADCVNSSPPSDFPKISGVSVEFGRLREIREISGKLRGIQWGFV